MQVAYLSRAIPAIRMWVTVLKTSHLLKTLVKCAHLELPYPQGRRLGVQVHDVPQTAALTASSNNDLLWPELQTLHVAHMA